MDRLNTTHQCNCMTWLGKCSKRHLVYLKKNTTANTQIQKVLLLKYKFVSIKKIQQRDIEYTAIYTANTAPKKAICMCIYSHKAICMCIYSHKAICMCIYSHKAICMCIYSHKAICMCIYSHKAICMCIYSHKAICMCIYSHKAIHAQALY